jgi:hypothetical protein
MRVLLLSVVLIFPFFCSGQSSDVHATAFGASQPISPDRAEDSYAIYSQLLPLGETASWPASYYDVRDTTITAVQSDSPCSIPSGTAPIDRVRGGMNPHVAVSPAERDRQDYEEILADFDTHCHERLTLSADFWKAKLPVQLLNEEEQSEFMDSRHSNSVTAEKYKGSAALYAFSQVYFNAHHTTAMVYATHWCGGLCGEGFWIAFARENGLWKQIHWRSISWIS